MAVQEVRKATKITVYDAICSTGKSSWLIDNLSKNWEANGISKPVLIIVPEKTEITRFISEPKLSHMRWVSPIDLYGNSNDVAETAIRDTLSEQDVLNFKADIKSNSIIKMLKEQRNICCTHSLFQLWTDEVSELVRQGQYHVYIDEEVQALRPMALGRNAINLLKTHGVIRIDTKTSQVEWVHDKFVDINLKDKDEYTRLYNAIESGTVYCYETINRDKTIRQFVVWEFRKDFFTAPESITLFSYRFKQGSYLYKYLTHHGFDVSINPMTSD